MGKGRQGGRTGGTEGGQEDEREGGREGGKEKQRLLCSIGVVSSLSHLPIILPFSQFPLSAGTLEPMGEEEAKREDGGREEDEAAKGVSCRWRIKKGWMEVILWCLGSRRRGEGRRTSLTMGEGGGNKIKIGRKEGGREGGMEGGGKRCLHHVKRNRQTKKLSARSLSCPYFMYCLVLF